MTERPILFSGPMVRAILEGRKTQTRRVYKGTERRPEPGLVWAECLCREIDPSDTPCVICHRRFGDCPYGSPGDTLWVRETHQIALRDKPDGAEGPTREHEEAGSGFWDVPVYRATCGVRDEHYYRWRPSIHMPRWASRLTLRIASVRVERLTSITVQDVLAEGVELDGSRGAIAQWVDLWDSINGKRAPWASDPWVWVVSFSRVEVADAR